MVTLIRDDVFLVKGELVRKCDMDALLYAENVRHRGTMTYKILDAHSVSKDPALLNIKFDVVSSHETTYVGIIQSARASGLERFPVPYVMTNCHNSLCTEGGTINEDDHVFGYSAAKKYGGIFVPLHQSILHQYNREIMAECGNMIIGSDSHTRYGAFGSMGIGEGGPELVKQLLSATYDIPYPKVIAVQLKGAPKNGVGPQDVALAIIAATFKERFANNAVLEFIGEGISGLSAEFRHGIDVMTTETTCLSTIWQTDDAIREYYKIHGRPGAYKEMKPLEGACYDGAILVDLSKVKAMIALPFHPSNAFPIDEFNSNSEDILHETEKICAEQLGYPELEVKLIDKLVNGRLRVQQGSIGGCSGGSFENICAAAAILKNQKIDLDGFAMSIYPGSTPITQALIQNGAMEALISAGAVLKTAFCGTCFGAGEVPANNQISIRHATRNFANREGSKPGNGQMAYVALMDARSIAATAKNGGSLTAATEDGVPEHDTTYHFNDKIYERTVYNGFGKGDSSIELVFGPNIVDWPEMIPLNDNLLLRLSSVIHDPVTTTDELIPSGDHTSYRSNPQRMAQFTLYRKDPPYRAHAKVIYDAELARQSGSPLPEELKKALDILSGGTALPHNTGLGSAVYAVNPGDGSAREYAASCQRVLGGCANIVREYATKRYRTNLINWGILPLEFDGEFSLVRDDFVYLPDIRTAIKEKRSQITAYIFDVNGDRKILELRLGEMTDKEREILLFGSLINYYRVRTKEVATVD